MFQSPLKTISEKVRPVSSKSSVSSLNFDRISDFKKFINFIKKETKELENIPVPKVPEVRGKLKKTGLLGLGFIGLLSLFGGGKGDGDGEEKKRFGLAGGTESQFKDIDLPLIRGLRRTPPRITNKRVKLVTTKKEKQKQRIKVKKIKRDKMRRNRRINVELQKRQQLFAKTFLNEKKIYLNKVRKNMQLPDFVTDADIEQMINEDFGQNLEKYIEDLTKKKLLKKFGFVDPTDPKARRQVAVDINTEDFLNRISKPLTIEEVRVLQDMANQTENIKGGVDKKGVVYPDVEVTQDAEFAREALKDPEVKKIIKEDKFQKITGIDTPEATSFFKGKFTPKYVLDDIFTSIGKNTKGFRDFISAGFSKIPIPKKAVSIAKPFLKKGAFVFDFATAGIELYKILEGFVVGDNILTSFYDLGVSIHNTFQPDKTKLITYITNSRDSRLRAITDQKNQKILSQIQQARQAQASNNNISPTSNQSNIIPEANKKKNGGQSMIPFSPQYGGLLFIMEKLYKQ